jgi:hypothetical protein
MPAQIDVEDFEDIKSGYKIVLHFAADCPFFENASLTKHYRYTDDGELEVTGDVPKWKEGHVSGSGTPHARAHARGGRAAVAPSCTCTSAGGVL